MRRATTITLALLGGGALAAGIAAFPTRRDECAAARAAQDKFADDVCSRTAGASSRSSWYSGYWGGHSASSGSSFSSSSRGGFGSTAASYSGSGG